MLMRKKPGLWRQPAWLTVGLSHCLRCDPDRVASQPSAFVSWSTTGAHCNASLRGWLGEPTVHRTPSTVPVVINDKYDDDESMRPQLQSGFPNPTEHTTTVK